MEVEEDSQSQSVDGSVESVDVYQSSRLFTKICLTNGLPQISLLAFLLGAIIGCSVAIFPNITTTRYAVKRFSYTGEAYCQDIIDDIESPCYKGSQMAQDATAYSGLFKNLLAFITCPIIGQISDRKGRKIFFILAILLLMLSSTLLLVMVIFTSFNPLWYFISRSLDGMINLFAFFLASSADLIAIDIKTATFGIISCCFALGIALAPMITIVMDNFYTSILLIGLGTTQLGITLFLLPETLSEAKRDQAVQRYEEKLTASSRQPFHFIVQPFREILLLNKRRGFQVVSAITFLSTLAASIEFFLLVFFLEENKGFGREDIAIFLAIAGIFTILTFGILLKPLNDSIGEKGILLVVCVIGALTGFTKLAMPTIGAIASNNVHDDEQGSIQGVFFSITSFASAIGPLFFRAIYYLFQDIGTLGSGNMFLFASLLYALALMCVCLLPGNLANSSNLHGAFQS